MKDRIYICHTYYHAYVTFLKELKIRAEADPARKAVFCQLREKVLSLLIELQDFLKQARALHPGLQIFKIVGHFGQH